MKKIKFTALFTVLFASLAITSCSKDDSNDNPNDSVGTTTGDYYPMAVNNQWDYEQDGNSAQPIKLTGTDVFNGTTYYRLYDENEYDIKAWVAKKGATYYEKIGDVNISEEGFAMTMQGYEIPMLKDDLAVNGTWTGNVSSNVTYTFGTESIPSTMKIKYTGTILEKGATEIVNEETYTDIIKSFVRQEMTIEGEVTVVDSETWYSKNVGPIKTVMTQDGETTERILVDYSLN